MKALIILSILLGSCTPAKPYELKSPCASTENISNPWQMVPCVKRKINSFQII